MFLFFNEPMWHGDGIIYTCIYIILSYISAWGKIAKNMSSKHDITETWMKRAARADVPEVCLVVEGTSLCVDKRELFLESPVLERLVKTEYGKREQQIHIKGKRRKDVINFLRCTMPGVLQPMDSKFNCNERKYWEYIKRRVWR